MAQVTRCPHCGRSLQIADDALGKPVRCPVCKQLFAVRAAPTPSSPYPPPRSDLREERGRAPAAQAEVTVGAKVAGGSVAQIDAPPRPVRPSSRVAPSPPAGLTECPACKAQLLPGAGACVECGYLLPGEGAALEAEGTPNLCPN